MELGKTIATCNLCLWLRASATRIFLSLAAAASANAEMLNPGNKELGETIATRNLCLWLCASATRIFLSLAATANANAEMLNPGNKELGKTIATRNFISLAACHCNAHLFVFGSGSQCKCGNVESR